MAFCTSCSSTAADLYGCCCVFCGGNIIGAAEEPGAIHLPIPPFIHSPGTKEPPGVGTLYCKGGWDTTTG